MLSPLLAVLAAAANALASVLQRKAARDEPASENLSLRLVWHLLHRPVWFGGMASVIASFFLQAAALGSGQLAVVEPILILELPITLILTAVFFGSRLRSREWGTSVAMTAGLAALLVALSPSSGKSTEVPWQVWVAALGANLLVIAAGVAWGRFRTPGAGRGGILGVATGCGFALTAALMKGMTSQFSHGFSALFTSWQLYGMIASGVGSIFLLQSAVHAGRLLAVQPGLTLSDPLVSILWGIFVFDEQVRTGWFLIIAVLGAAVVAGAVVTLARSPLLSGEAGQTDEDLQSQKTNG